MDISVLATIGFTVAAMVGLLALFIVSLKKQ
jgi:hypothetical protein